MKILVIQTAFIGDVILATSLLESIHLANPTANIHVVLRKGNEAVLDAHPFVKHVHIWDKKNSKYANLFKLAANIRREKFDMVINLQRYGSTGFLTLRSGAKIRAGFRGGLFSPFYTHKTYHDTKSGLHETTRNYLLATVADVKIQEQKKPKLYPTAANFEKVKGLVSGEYVVMAPASVWFTKQLPESKWVELIQKKSKDLTICLVGAETDHDLLDRIKQVSGHLGVKNFAGKLNLLESAALIGGAVHCYVNDSAPLHLASAMNAPVTAFFCSTIPDFGFGPRSDKSRVVQVSEVLACRPCGLHGRKACPKGHFRCGNDISVDHV